MSATAELPWCDCKVAFAIDDPERFEVAMVRTNDFAHLLPVGWSLCETDGSGARYVACFRVEGRLSEIDGALVQSMLERAQRPPRTRKRRPQAPA